ncbi:WD40-repeat-containing domain protein [Mycena olivaceomarginata]|nr:WD40-repeat-containing domain protein [Mycena olivaceomarginata]
MPEPRPEYTPQRGLKDHPGTILALAATADGKTLVTGGSDGTRLWDSKKLTAISRPVIAGVRGATTVIVCVRRVDEPVDVIFSGTSNGFFFCWRNRKGIWEETFARQIDEPTDITGIAFDTSANRLAICSAGGRVQSWSAVRDDSGRVHLSKVFCRDVGNFAPRAIMFAGYDASKDKDILLFGQNVTGPIYKLRGKTGDKAEEWLVGSPIGDARADWKEGLVLFDDIHSGPSLWRYHDYTRIRMYYIRCDRKYGRVRNVRFAEGGNIVVCGSDHGLVYIFNLQTGERLQKLALETTEWVQVIATAEVDGVPTVFAAPSRSDDTDVKLYVWKRLEPEPEAKPSTFWKTIWLWLVRIVVICCCLGFLVQNVQHARGLLRTAVEPAAEVTVEAQGFGEEIVGALLDGDSS